jgi:autotransporter adhesin
LSRATGEDSTATGRDSQATGEDSTATGRNSQATGAGSTATGAGSFAASSSTATGLNSQATGFGSTATGAGSTASSDASTALGALSAATGIGGTAVGAGSQVTTAESAAIGNASITSSGRDRVVSVGSGSGRVPTRIIENVTNGEYGNDAATVQQLPGQFVDTQGNASATPTNIFRFGNNAGQSQGMDTTSDQVTLTNVKAGAVNANSTDVVNGSQLHETNQAVSTNTVQIQAIVNGQLGVCTVNNGALQCSVTGQKPASANGQGAQAIGIDAQANGQGAIAQGDGAVANYAGSIAIGAGARALADPTVAIGYNALAQGNNSVALGANSVANGNNSVAIGQGSVADRNNSVSVGNSAQQRQITNVAPATEGTDAVNLNQLQSTQNNTLSQANAYAAEGIAAAIAQTTPQIRPGQNNALAVKYGNYDGYSAIGASYAHGFSDSIIGTIGISVGTNSGNVGIGTGLQIGW